MIKWPNDIVIGPKKICGILAERSLTPLGQAFIALGIGINVNAGVFPDELQKKCSSLFLETGRKQNRAALFLQTLSCLDKLYSQPEAPIADYAALCVTLGREICYSRENQILLGKAIQILPNGELLVLRTDGRGYCSSGWGGSGHRECLADVASRVWRNLNNLIPYSRKRIA